MSVNPIEQQTEEQARRAYLIDTFGPDVVLGLSTEEPIPSNRPTTASRHADEYRRTTREHQHAQDLELVQVAAREREDDAALEMVLARMRKGGGRVPKGSMRAAARALERQGFTRGTTAQRLAAAAAGQAAWRRSA
jgi:hypothetical protein